MWATLKTHFTSARRYLKKVRGRTMQTAGFHQANLISSSLDTVCAEVLAEVLNVQNIVLEAMTNVQPPADPS